jgi:hypothetical protein
MTEARQAIEDFLRKKAISPADFLAQRPADFQSMEQLLQLAGPKSLDYAKKFLWNDLRSAFPLNNIL